MKTIITRPRSIYASPTTRIIEVKLGSNMMLLNSNGKTGQATLDTLEEEDYSNTTWY